MRKWTGLATAALILVRAGFGGEAGVAVAQSATNGEALFRGETFGGNGRTCGTCHTEAATGQTLTIQEIGERYQTNPNDPLFRPVDSDDETGASYERLRKYGTFRVTITLPPNVYIKEDPDARTVDLFRAVPPVLNVATELRAADRLEEVPVGPVFLWDGRATELNVQAAGAILDHFGVSIPHTDARITDIVAYEKTLFAAATSENTQALIDWAAGGLPPVLPAGTTESEQRGRKFFDDSDPETRKTAACAFCHSGPMLNEVNGLRDKAIFGQGQLLEGDRFVTVLVSENELIGTPRVVDGPSVTPLRNPIRTWVVDPDENGEVTEVTSPDPGRLLTTGLAIDRNRFKVPTLWGSKDTAPYFHDNSASSLEQVMEHYRSFFILAQPPPEENPPIVLTPQDVEDIIAFLKLL